MRIDVLIIFIVSIELSSILFYMYLSRNDISRRGVMAVKYIISSDTNFHPGEYSPSPYLLYRNKINHSHMGIRQTDQNGYRWHGLELSVTPKTQEFRILCLGGSTTYSNHVTRDIEKSWCYILERQLSARHRGNIRVINAGLNYAMSAELLAHYVFQAHNFNPELVIIHGPGNDTLAVANGDSTSDYRNTRKSLYFQKRTFERTILKFSAFVRMLYVIWLDKSSLVSLEPEKMPPVKIQNERLKTSEFLQYKSNLENMVILMLSKGSKVVLAPFVQASPSKIEENHPGLSEGMLTANAKMTEIMRCLAGTNENIYFLDFDQFKFEDELFVDSCHLGHKGENLKAQIICDFILSKNLVTQPA